jgi:predicted nucleic acid-binding protein
MSSACRPDASARAATIASAAVSLADCVAAAAALAIDSPLATSDPALAEVLRSEGGKVHPLPDSKGQRP